VVAVPSRICVDVFGSGGGHRRLMPRPYGSNSHMRQARSRQRCQAFPAHPMGTSLRPRLPATYLRRRYGQRAERVDRPVEPAGRGRPRQPLQGATGTLLPGCRPTSRAYAAGQIAVNGKYDLWSLRGTRRDDPRRWHLLDHGLPRPGSIDGGEITQQPTESRAPVQPAPALAPPAGEVSDRNSTAAGAAVLPPAMRNLATHASATATETASRANDPRLAGRSTADPVSLSQPDTGVLAEVPSSGWRGSDLGLRVATDLGRVLASRLWRAPSWPSTEYSSRWR
jgi:hypothetical protein